MSLVSQESYKMHHVVEVGGGNEDDTGEKMQMILCGFEFSEKIICVPLDFHKRQSCESQNSPISFPNIWVDVNM